MSKKWFVLSPLIAAFFVGSLLLAVVVMPVRAQCGEPQPPKCVSCHPTQAQSDVPDDWHSTHYSKATCLDCHGGNGMASEEAAAHQSMVANPLNDIYTSCHQCHPQNYQTVASVYASALNITPGSCTTPTPAPMGPVPGGAGGWTLGQLSNSATNSFQRLSIGWMVAGLILLAAFLASVGWLERHNLGR